MTKKDYILIAKVIKHEAGKWEAKNSLATIVIGNIYEAFCTELKLENPAFDRQKFLKACEVTN